MDNKIIEELKIFTDAQKENMTNTINALIEKGEEALGTAHREDSQVGEYSEKLLGQKIVLQEKLAAALPAWMWGDEERAEIDKIQEEIANVKVRQSEIPQLEQAVERCIAQAITKLKNARRLTSKLEYCYKLQLRMIETTAPEPPAEMIRDLHVYAVEIPSGQVELFDKFIAKLYEIKYPELGK